MLRNLWVFLGLVAVLLAIGLLVKTGLKPVQVHELPPPPVTPTPTPSVGQEAQDPTADKVPYSEEDTFVRISTTQGDMYAELYDELMPRTTQHFRKLVESQFYDGSPFHRVVSGFVIQAGQSQPGQVPTLQFEKSPVQHDRGVLSMARVAGDYDSASSSFFICLGRSPHLDGEYAAFGRVIFNTDAAYAIAARAAGEEFPAHPEKIISLRVVTWDEVKQKMEEPPEHQH